jgi:hypothetical protein
MDVGRAPARRSGGRERLMQCRQCGTTIADKAIVCFRCGAPTMEGPPERPTSRAARGPAWRGPLAATVVLAGGAWASLVWLSEPMARAGGVAAAVVLAVTVFLALRPRRPGGV